jgi:putative heme-binding domain-containing protein
MTRFVESMDSETLDRAVVAGLAHEDRLVRQAAARLEKERRRRATTALADARAPGDALALAHLLAAGFSETVCQARLTEALAEFDDSSAAERLSMIRAAQLLAGDIGETTRRGQVWHGYSRRSTSPVVGIEEIVNHYPTGVSEVDRELLRLAAMVRLADGRLEGVLLDELAWEEDPVDAIHRLIVLARLQGPVPSEADDVVARAMVELPRRLRQRNRVIDRNWPMRMRELQVGLAKRYVRLHTSTVDLSDFGSFIDDLLWTEAPGFDRKKAAEKYLRARASRPVEPLSVDGVELLAVLPASRVAALLREHWDEVALRDGIVRVLAREPMADDVERFVDRLSSGDEKTRRACLESLERLSLNRDDALAERAAAAYARWRKQPESAAWASRLATIVARLAGEPASSASREEWIGGMVERAERREQSAGEDRRRQWQQRWTQAKNLPGDAARGERLFAQLGCQACHSGARSVGPDLAGVGRRFSRDDLMTSIVEPSRDVPDRYRADRFVTDDGRVYQGIVVYEAVDGLIVQQSNLETVRLSPTEIVERRQSQASLMPEGLLDQLSAESIADIARYVSGL